MLTRIIVNVQTGEVAEVPLTQEEIGEIAASETIKPVTSAPIDPVEKLRSFLASNPDVAAIL